MKKLIFATVFLSCATLVQTQVPSLDSGLKQLQNENYSAAMNTFTAIAKNEPKNGTIYYYIGEVNYRMEDYAAADKAYKKGLSINSSCAECKVGLGKLMLDQDKTTEAKEYFESASKLDKKNPEIFAMIGEAYLFNKKPNGSKAVEYLSTARDMDTSKARYWAHLGDAYRMVGNNGEAMTSYEDAIRKDPTLSSAYISMARIWAAAKQDSLALPLLLKAIELSPDDAQPYKELIELYIRNNQYDKVTPLLEKYVALTGNDVDAKVRLIKFFTFQAKDYDRAIIEGEKLIKTNPEQYTIFRWLAWSYGEKELWQQSYDNSVKLFDAIKMKEGRQAFPSDYDYWAKAAFNLGNLDEAAHIYRKYLELVPSRSQEINGMLAKAYFDAKNYAQAIAYYNRKGEEKPLSVVDNYYLGLAYYYIDENLKADSTFIKVLEVTPDYAQGWMMRARIANRLETADSTSAVKVYRPLVPYQKYVEFAAGEPEKNSKNLIESYKYLAYYWVQHEDLDQAKLYYEKVLELDPEDAVAKENLALIKDQ